MKKYLFPALCATLFAFAGCSDDDNVVPPPTIDPVEEAHTAYVLNQGSMYSGIDGTLDVLVESDSTYLSNQFFAANGQSLGDSPQEGVVYGSHLYVAVYGSNLVWVLDRQTLSIKTMVQTNEPEGICAAEGAVFVSNNDGYVSRIDTTTFSVTDHVAVGPNPAQMVAVGKYVYVSISDGYNYNNQYANGFKVAKIDAESCEVTSQIAVGMNPGPLCADNQGNVYVVARGNYGDIAPAVWKIHTNDAAFYFCEGSNVTCNGSTLYVLNNYTNWYANPVVSILTYAAYDVADGSCITDKLLEGQPQPEAPTFIRVNPRDGNVYMGSNASSNDYTSPGYLYRYDADGKFVAKYNAGVAPCSIIF